MDGYITFLVTVCLSIIGSWYLQKNVVNTLKGEMEQLKDDIKKQEMQITDQNALIEDLKSKYEESTKVSIWVLHICLHGNIIRSHNYSHRDRWQKWEVDPPKL